MIVTAKCPYCGCNNPLSVAAENHVGREVIICETEGGGCDRIFVALWSVGVQVSCKEVQNERERV